MVSKTSKKKVVKAVKKQPSPAAVLKKVRCKIKNVKSHLFTTSGSWSSTWNVFSARPFVVSMNPLGQYSHCII